MNMHRIAVFFAVVFSLNIAICWAQSSDETAAIDAERAGRLREALTHYAAALQRTADGSADDQRLREAIIKLAQRLSPSPTIPDEARRFSVRGQIAIKEAKSSLDFEEAAKEFGKALRVAPWWADSYFNQGVALEKAGKFNEAIRSLKFYLLAAPNNPDAQKVKDQIFALEYRQEKMQKDRVEQQQAAVEKRNRWLQQLAGRWMRDESDSSCKRTHYYQLNVSGSDINLKWVSFDVRKIAGPSGMTCGGGYHPGTVWEVQGWLDDHRGITGRLTYITPIYMMAQYGATFRACASKGKVTLDSRVDGSISEDGRTMVIKYDQEDIDTTGRCEPNGRYSTYKFSLQRE